MRIADLTSPRAKLGRATEHIRDIDAELQAFREQYAGSSGVTFWRDGPWHVVSLNPLPQLPERLPLVAGDCLNNLRAALDHLIWQLVVREDQEPRHTHRFPICQTRQKFPNEAKRSSMYGIPINGDAWALIERAQPFNRPEPKNDVLSVLSHLNNVDKHRTLLVQRSYVEPEVIAQSLRWDPHLQPVRWEFQRAPWSDKLPTHIIRVRFAGDANVCMDMTRDIPLEPTIGDGQTNAGLRLLNDARLYIQQLLDNVAALPRVQG